MRFLLILAIASLFFTSCSKKISTEELLNQKVDSVLRIMTLQEKVGQMAMLSSWGYENQPLNDDESYLEEIKAGRVGSMLNVNGAEQTAKLQKIAVEESRLGIPLIFAFDVIHGYKTIFPIPIALASTWDTANVCRAARVFATEATASGQHWTFAPIVDVARDPRWGRIAESSGEDPFLTSAMAIAYIKGFQGNNLADRNTMAACAKHFIAYGAAEGGRDYNTCEVSDRTLQEFYMPPFKAATDAHVASIMMALNDLNGSPSSANEALKKIIRDNWHYNSILISDWNSIGELVTQGRASSAYEAGLLAFKTSIDIDLQGNIYVNQLEKLLNKGLINEKDINNAVGRILKLKFELGLFDNPYKYCNQKLEEETLLNQYNLQSARDIAAQSIVLLKNADHILPIKNEELKIALVGPLAKDKANILGSWRALGDTSDASNIYTGLKNMLPKAGINYSRGCGIDDGDKSAFNHAIQLAKKSDIIIAAMGERSPPLNKTLSTSNISLPGTQQDLLKELKKTGKPIILILLNGRPLALDWESKNMDAIIEAWFPGTTTGDAIAQILTGKVNPSAKLPVSFPYSTGQVPVYYNHKKIGQTPLPNSSGQVKYDDGPEEALYPFGYGLSYTVFEYSDLTVSNKYLKQSDTLNVRITVANTGNMDGAETVQLYIRDLVGSVTRPVAELKGFKKIYLQTGQSKEVQFRIAVTDLAFLNAEMKRNVEPGEFLVMAGSSSTHCTRKNFFVSDKP
jgi:beta-glucosidase